MWEYRINVIYENLNWSILNLVNKDMDGRNMIKQILSHKISESWKLLSELLVESRKVAKTPKWDALFGLYRGNFNPIGKSFPKSNI